MWTHGGPYGHPLVWTYAPLRSVRFSIKLIHLPKTNFSVTCFKKDVCNKCFSFCFCIKCLLLNQQKLKNVSLCILDVRLFFTWICPHFMSHAFLCSSALLWLVSLGLSHLKSYINGIVISICIAHSLNCPHRKNSNTYEERWSNKIFIFILSYLEKRERKQRNIIVSFNLESDTNAHDN